MAWWHGLLSEQRRYRTSKIMRIQYVGGVARMFMTRHGGGLTKMSMIPSLCRRKNEIEPARKSIYDVKVNRNTSSNSGGHMKNAKTYLLLLTVLVLIGLTEQAGDIKS